MQLREHIGRGVIILEPRERLTVENEDEFKQAVRRHLDAGCVRLVLDLAQVPYIDSCGLGTIAQTHLAASRRGGWLKLHNVSGRNRQLLTVTRLLSVIGLYEPEAQAATA
jgi:anti-sigma B factor antagonist